ncbi:hypothetical protein PCE1_001343 [Barthelona sp. PCE]
MPRAKPYSDGLAFSSFDGAVLVHDRTLTLTKRSFGSTPILSDVIGRVRCDKGATERQDWACDPFKCINSDIYVFHTYSRREDVSTFTFVDLLGEKPTTERWIDMGDPEDFFFVVFSPQTILVRVYSGDLVLIHNDEMTEIEETEGMELVYCYGQPNFCFLKRNDFEYYCLKINDGVPTVNFLFTSEHPLVQVGFENVRVSFFCISEEKKLLVNSVYDGASVTNLEFTLPFEGLDHHFSLCLSKITQNFLCLFNRNRLYHIFKGNSYHTHSFLFESGVSPTMWLSKNNSGPYTLPFTATVQGGLYGYWPNEIAQVFFTDEHDIIAQRIPLVEFSTIDSTIMLQSSRLFINIEKKRVLVMRNSYYNSYMFFKHVDAVEGCVYFQIRNEDNAFLRIDDKGANIVHGLCKRGFRNVDSSTLSFLDVWKQNPYVDNLFCGWGVESGDLIVAVLGEDGVEQEQILNVDRGHVGQWLSDSLLAVYRNCSKEEPITMFVDVNFNRNEPLLVIECNLPLCSDDLSRATCGHDSFSIFKWGEDAFIDVQTFYINQGFRCEKKEISLVWLLSNSTIIDCYGAAVKYEHDRNMAM